MAQIPIKNGFNPYYIANTLKVTHQIADVGGDIYYADCDINESHNLFLNESILRFPDINCNNIYKVFVQDELSYHTNTYYTGGVYNKISTTQFLLKGSDDENLARMKTIPPGLWSEQGGYYTGTTMSFAVGDFNGENFIDITQAPPRLPINIGRNIISVVKCVIDGSFKYLNLNALYGLTWALPSQIIGDEVNVFKEYSFNTYDEAVNWKNTHSRIPNALATYINFYQDYPDDYMPFHTYNRPFNSISWDTMVDGSMDGSNIILPYGYKNYPIFSSNTRIIAKPADDELNLETISNYYIYPGVGQMGGRKEVIGSDFYYRAYSSICNCLFCYENGPKFTDLVVNSKGILQSRYLHVNKIAPSEPYTDFGDYGSPSTPSEVDGGYDGKPGPSIAENLPNGSFGADIASSGMYTKYLCNNALLDTLAEFFWEDNIGIQALKAVLGNPIDSIISLTAYPFALETLVPSTPTTIYFGQYDSHFSAFSLTKSSFQIDWGAVTIPFFWGSFLDYSPYTKIQLYLPWGVGFVSIDPNEVVPWSSKNSFNKNDFVDGTIRVVTNIELDKGACVHNIIGNNGRVIGSFGGVVGKQIPVTGSDNSARIISIIRAATSFSIEGAVQSLSTAVTSPPSYPRAGTFSDATNTLGYQYPYLIISRPSQSVPQQYGRFMGYPSNIFHSKLSEVSGYTEVSSIHLENINATANELDELESILKGGVLL